MKPSHLLLETDLFKTRSELLSTAARVDISYKRAKAIGLSYALSRNDILHLSQKFWDLHLDPITPLDGAATTLLTIQYNLVAGTIARFSEERKDLVSLVDDLLSFRILGQFCLTELGRGLDVYNMKTTATLLPSGEFDLHTPDIYAAKFMPPTIPVLGIPCIGVIFSRLIVDGEYRGIRPFIVQLNDGFQMCEGISAKQLPPRNGSKPVNHALTSFNHVRLPSTALLGTLVKPQSPHSDFTASIWRVSVGTLALAFATIPAFELSCYIAGRYSLRRHVTGPAGEQVPIASFRTQQIPLFAAIAQAVVVKAFCKRAIAWFMDEGLDPRARRGVAACAKALMVLHSQTANTMLSERCGAQGLFEFNHISSVYSEIRGISIAEGDILGLSMRLVADLLAQKYELPPPSDPSGLLAKREVTLFQELLHAVQNSSDPMGSFYKTILPRCQSTVEAIGFRMAYEAAVMEGVTPCLLDLYVCNAAKTDLAWYVESGHTRAEFAEMEDHALDAAVPRLEEFLQGLDVDRYALAPITTDEKWIAFSDSLKTYAGSGSSATEGILWRQAERARL